MKYKNRYHQLSYKYLTEAKRALKERKYTQASEKLWGASAQMIKAVAQKNGWKHKSHDALWNISTNLSERYNDPDILRLFGLASSLHQNFYENWMPARVVKKAVRETVFFIKKLEKLL